MVKIAQGLYNFKASSVLKFKLKRAKKKKKKREREREKNKKVKLRSNFKYWLQRVWNFAKIEGKFVAFNTIILFCLPQQK